MTILTESLAPFAPMVSEAEGYRSRSVATVAASQTVVVGAVLGKVTASGAYVVLAPAAADGSQNVAAVAMQRVTTGAGQTKQITVIDLDAELRAADLTWPSGITAPQTVTATAQLLALGIKLR